MVAWINCVMFHVTEYLSLKKELTTEISNKNEYQKHNAKEDQKKKKGYIYGYHSIYVTF